MQVGWGPPESQWAATHVKVKGRKMAGAKSLLQSQARALGDPTRHKVFRYIADASRAVDIAELARHLSVHHNAIRQHLTKLVEAGLVDQSTAPTVGRGRPRLCYTINLTAESRWGVSGPYERLSLLLSEIIRSGDTPVDVGRRAGHQEFDGAQKDGDPVGGLVAWMDRHGFEPTTRQKGTQVDIVLGACPIGNAAIADPGTVCGLHLGLALGAAEVMGGLVIDELITRDPRKGTCRLRCRIAP
jgi:predicted ArsR family transcriptional regulator